MGRVGSAHRGRAIVCGVLLALAWLGAAAPPERGAPAAAQGMAGRVPILVYHAIDDSGSAYSVTPARLDEQCRWLVENGYTAITLGQFWAAAQGAAALPPNPVVLTNDDGWPSAFVFADVLARYGLVGNSFVNNVSPLAPDQIALLAQRGPV